MSRPAAPSYTVEDFAPDADYPAGGNSWNGNPTKVIPPGQTSVGFSPNQGNAAQYHNWAHNAWSVAHAAVKSFLITFFAWFLARYLQLAARNWYAPLSCVVGSREVRYANGTYFVGGSDGSGKAAVGRTTDPQVWATTNETSGNVFTSTFGNFDAATDGSLVVPGSGATDGTKVLECTAGGSWTVHTSMFATALINPDCVYEPLSTNWIVFGKRNGAFLADVYTSTNRTAWTAQTPPASIPNDGVGGPYVTMGKDGLGKVVAQFHPAAVPGNDVTNSVSFSCSADGGVTWSAVDTHVTAFATAGSNAQHARPIWSGTNWVAVEFSAQDVACYVYNSADGITWTQVANLTTNAIQSIAPDTEGGVVFGVTSTGKQVYSIDEGATWFPVGIKLATTYVRAFAANGGLVMTDPTNAKIRHSILLGQGPGVALT